MHVPETPELLRRVPMCELETPLALRAVKEIQHNSSPLLGRRMHVPFDNLSDFSETDQEMPRVTQLTVPRFQPKATSAHKGTRVEVAALPLEPKNELARVKKAKINPRLPTSSVPNAPAALPAVPVSVDSIFSDPCRTAPVATIEEAERLARLKWPTSNFIVYISRLAGTSKMYEAAKWEGPYSHELKFNPEDVTNAVDRELSVMNCTKCIHNILVSRLLAGGKPYFAPLCRRCGHLMVMKIAGDREYCFQQIVNGAITYVCNNCQ